MAVTNDIFRHILAFFFPPACLVCQRVEGVESLPLALCGRCRGELRPIAGNCCAVCLRPLTGSDTALNRCLACRDLPAPVDRVLSGWSFEPPFDAVIHALKFGRMEFLGQHLAAALQRVFGEELLEVDVVVPIPLHWYRRMRRGYNQAEAIARPLARRAGLPLVSALRRCRFTRPQARLDRQRREANLRLAFASPIGHRCTIADRRVLLVDDVVTTGATVKAAAVCLRGCGARTVTALTAGRTPVRERPGAGPNKEGF